MGTRPRPLLVLSSTRLPLLPGRGPQLQWLLPAPCVARPSLFGLLGGLPLHGKICVGRSWDFLHWAHSGLRRWLSLALHLSDLPWIFTVLPKVTGQAAGAQDPEEFACYLKFRGKSECASPCPPIIFMRTSLVLNVFVKLQLFPRFLFILALLATLLPVPRGLSFCPLQHCMQSLVFWLLPI